MQTHDWLKLFAALALPQIAGAIGAIFTMPKIDGWYVQLVRPELAPPNWLFAPVWTTLFILMGVAAFIVWRRGAEDGRVRMALAAFVAQLGLNALWSFLFFGLENPGWALAEIGILWLAILATMLLFLRVSRVAAYLLAPYLLWVTFASYLNYQFWMLN